MATSAEPDERKRKSEVNEEKGDDAADDEWIGPMPSEAVQPKKRKGEHYLLVQYYYK